MKSLFAFRWPVCPLLFNSLIFNCNLHFAAVEFKKASLKPTRFRASCYSVWLEARWAFRPFPAECTRYGFDSDLLPELLV